MTLQWLTGPSLIKGLTLSMLLTGMVASPALADAPAVVTAHAEFEDVNPCDPPSTQLVTIDFVIKVHEHANNYVETISSWASTDDGFSGPGHQTTVVAGDTERAIWNFIQTNSETGQKYTVKGRAVVDLTSGDVLFEVQELRCIIW